MKTNQNSFKLEPEKLARDVNRHLKELGNDAASIAAALGQYAKQYGMARLAKETGLSRESLYKTFSGTRSPEFSTVLKVLAALNLSFAVRDNSISTK